MGAAGGGEDRGKGSKKAGYGESDNSDSVNNKNDGGADNYGGSNNDGGGEDGSKAISNNNNHTFSLGGGIKGHDCGGGMRVRSAGNCVRESQVIGIQGSWTDECDACGKNLVEQGLISSFHCYKYRVAGIPAQMNMQYPCLTNEPVGKDCCSWAG